MSRDFQFGALDYGGPVGRPFDPFPSSALDGSVVDRFGSMAERFPGRLAIQDLTRALSYSDLAGMVRQIAEATEAAVGGREGPVAILLGSEARFPAVMLGILSAGRPYVLLDSEQPMTRNRLIAEQAGTVLVISAGGLARDADASFSKDMTVLDLEYLDRLPRAKPVRRPGPDDACYVAYTSGSGGAPKGVYWNHRSLLHTVLQFTNGMHISREDRLALVYSPSSVAGTRSTYGALLNGASVHILPPLELNATGLVREMRSREVSFLHAVPTLFRRIAQAAGPAERLDSLRVVYLTGESTRWSDVDEFRRVCAADSLLCVALASSECQSHIYWFVDEKMRATHPQLPVGRAVPERNVTLVGDDGKPVGVDEVGEIVVSSRYIASGYWKAPELTHQAFSIDPTDSQTRIFRSGDLGRWRDGLLEYIGRKDEQVKLRGHRVHPGEIERVLMSLPEVAEAAVVVRRNADGTTRSLAAYATLGPEIQGLLPRHLAAMVQQRLPSHLVPWPIFVVDDLPRLPGLKIDRARLAEMDVERLTAGSDEIENEVVAEVVRIFEQVIGVSGATADDNIASLGGDSLQAVDVAAELERRFGVTISDETMASAQTIAELASWIDVQRKAVDGPGQQAHVRE